VICLRLIASHCSTALSIVIKSFIDQARVQLFSKQSIYQHHQQQQQQEQQQQQQQQHKCFTHEQQE
jgi:hypothetical protein